MACKNLGINHLPRHKRIHMTTNIITMIVAAVVRHTPNTAGDITIADGQGWEEFGVGVAKTENILSFLMAIYALHVRVMVIQAIGPMFNLIKQLPTFTARRALYHQVVIIVLTF